MGGERHVQEKGGEEVLFHGERGENFDLFRVVVRKLCLLKFQIMRQIPCGAIMHNNVYLDSKSTPCDSCEWKGIRA